MKSKVHFIRINGSLDLGAARTRFLNLLSGSGILDFIKKDDSVAIKMHFGEEGNTGYVKPQYLAALAAELTKKSARPFVSDTNTLYRGRRMNSVQHIALAREHGFGKEKTGLEVIVPDDTKKENVSTVQINKKFIKSAKVARIFLDSDVVLGVAHFKGHLMTGFGGALKNIGMGCASREGKLAQHSDVSPSVNTANCSGCGECLAVCPQEAITIVNKKSRIDNAKCIGCASCIAVCKYNAMDVNWEAGGSNIQEKMVEYCLAVLGGKKEKAAFINFCVKITQECDCLAKDDPAIAPDVGIMVSRDPVSIDKACLDLVNQAAGRDVFREAHPARDGLKQLNYAASLGLGSLDYELIEYA